jgi:protoheme IX farnesyltransferase
MVITIGHYLSVPSGRSKPPRFWALAIRYRDDYAAAGIPMQPLLVGDTGWLYPMAAIPLGAIFVTEAHLLLRRAHPRDQLVELRPMRLFHFSNVYLSLLFFSVALDPLVTRGH